MFLLTDRRRCLLQSGSSCNIRTQCLLLLLSTFLVSVSSFTCPPSWPCDVQAHCEEVDTSNCKHGIVKDACFCCDVCGHGPGEACGLEQGNCGIGLECVYNYPLGLSAADRATFPGECMFNENSTVGSNQTTETTTTEETTTAETWPTEASTSSPSSISGSICRPRCSVDYCAAATRQRICAAGGLAHSRVQGRGVCQHTSCRACFLHVKPNCTTTCTETPSKICLKRYYRCVQRFIFGNGNEKRTESLLIKLDNPNIRNYTGRLICYVPDV